MKEYAPIVLFVYNRPEHTRKTVEALQKNNLAKESELYIFADGPKEGASTEQNERIRKVREYVSTITGFSEVHIELSNKNKGLAKSIVYGVTKVVAEKGKVIVLEDDIVTSSHFLKYMNQSLDLYVYDEKVVCINSFSIIKDAPIKENTYFQYGADCQGWATWKRGWDLYNPDTANLQQIITRDKRLRKIFTYNDSFPYMDMLQNQIEGKIDSWAINWYASAVIYKKLCLYPSKSLMQNIGFDEMGTHTKKSDTYDASILADETTTEFPKIPIRESNTMRRALEKIFRKLYNTEKPSLFKRFKRMTKKMIQC